jgi:hypothetical protein
MARHRVVGTKESASREVEPRKWPARDEEADGCISEGTAMLQGFAARRRDSGVTGADVERAVHAMIPPRAVAGEVRAINLIDFSQDD